VNFYARKEIKDLLAYLKTIDNARDDLAVKRIINIPKRGIGAASINKVQDYADANSMSFYDGAKRAADIGTLGRASAKIEGFVNFIQVMRSKAQFLNVSELIKNIIEETGYVRELEAEDTPEADARIENIDELISKAASYEESQEVPTLSGFLEEVALVADIDDVDENSDYVVLMTLHSAKGLEFPNVYLAGMEDGLFPSYMTITSDNADEEMEEERRLCYVGITRAMKRLTITSAKMRMVRGETMFSKVSRFVSEIPVELLSGTVATGKSIPRERQEAPVNSYARNAKQILRSKPVVAVPAREFTTGTTEAMSLPYQEGDRVHHMKFGDGTVQKIQAGGRDYEVTVDFDRFGVKKMFASFAKLKKL
jgi:DNA helicase-2/ATP-dependent DNA helicase PcrA